MEATITTLGDIFKKKVIDSTKVPTIWIDGLTGDEHKDYDYLYIRSGNPMFYGWKGDPNDSSYVENDRTGKPGTLVVNGPITQIGSHVIACGQLADRIENYPCLDNLTDVFKYARNLETLNLTFARIYTGKNNLVLPEDLFWNCPKLKELNRLFNLTELKTIPSRLFERCPELKTFSSVFINTNVEDIPEDLFKNNPKITDFRKAFSLTSVKKIPDGLLAQFKDGIKKGLIDVTAFVESTPLEWEFQTGSVPPTTAEKKAKRAKYFPTYLTKEIQWRMLGNTSKKGYSDF